MAQCADRVTKSRDLGDVFSVPLLVLMPAHEPPDCEADWEPQGQCDDHVGDHRELETVPRYLSMVFRYVAFGPRRRCVSHAVSTQMRCTSVKLAGSASGISSG